MVKRGLKWTPFCHRDAAAASPASMRAAIASSMAARALARQRDQQRAVVVGRVAILVLIKGQLRGIARWAGCFRKPPPWMILAIRGHARRSRWS